MRGGLDPLRDPRVRVPLLAGHGVEVEVQSVAVHQCVVQDRLHVALQPLDGHVVQVMVVVMVVMLDRGGPVVSVAIDAAVIWRRRRCIYCSAPSSST